MKRILAISAVVAVLAPSAVFADERFVPEGFSYTPENTMLPPINSPAYKVIVEADRRAAEIHTSKRLRADHDDWRIYNMERDQQPPKNGWRRY